MTGIPARLGAYRKGASTITIAQSPSSTNRPFRLDRLSHAYLFVLGLITDARELSVARVDVADFSDCWDCRTMRSGIS